MHVLLCSLNLPLGDTCVYTSSGPNYSCMAFRAATSASHLGRLVELGFRGSYKWAAHSKSCSVGVTSFSEIFFSLFYWSISPFPRALFGVIWHVFHHHSSLYFLTGPSSQGLLSKQRRLQQDWDLQLYWRSLLLVLQASRMLFILAIYFPSVPLNSVCWFLCVIPSTGTIPESH